MLHSPDQLVDAGVGAESRAHADIRQSRPHQSVVRVDESAGVTSECDRDTIVDVVAGLAGVD
ncbi:MAG: hypothetical protein ACK57U_04210 [Planctomycetota bacterium]